MRLRSFLGVLLVLLMAAHDARAQCTRDPNDDFNQGGSGTAGFALTNTFLLSSPQDRYLPGYPRG